MAERPSKSAPSPKSHPDRWLVVGLGNPGAEFEHTRHNAGFLIVDKMADTWKMQKKAQALVAKHDENTFAKPQTFMNRSGESIRALVDWFDVLPSNTL
ncbi:MAG: aminoacyl-tRNA hydrolase, partial [Patescibacteria group bacterium]